MEGYWLRVCFLEVIGRGLLAMGLLAMGLLAGGYWPGDIGLIPARLVVAVAA